MNNRSPQWPLLIGAGLIWAAALGLGRQPLAQFFLHRGVQAKTEWRLEDAIHNLEWSIFLNRDLVEAKFEKGLCQQLRGNFLASKRDFDQLTPDTIRDSAMLARLLNAVGVNLFNTNEPDAAKEAHERSLDLATQLSDRRLEARVLIDLSRVLYHSKGQSAPALQHLERALKIGRDTGDELIEADALRNIGVVHWWLGGELDRPITDYYEPALKIYIRQNDLRSAAITLTNIGHVQYSKGDYLQFLKYQNEAIGIKRRIGDLAGLCDSYSAVGALYQTLENHRRASEYYTKSLELSRQIGYRLTQNDVETQLARLYTNLGEFDKAIEILKHLPERASQTPLLAKYYTSELANCYLLKGEAEFALPYARLALETSALDPAFETSALTRLAEVYTELGDWQNATSFLEQAETLLRSKQKLEAQEMDYHIVRGRLAELQGQRSVAISHLLKAVEIESNILGSDKNRFLRGQNRRVYDRLFTLLLEKAEDGSVNGVTRSRRSDDSIAFQLVERLKYRAFKNFVAHFREQKNAALRVKSKEKEATVRIEHLSEQLKVHESPSLRAQLRQAYSDYEDLILQSEMAQSRYKLAREGWPASLEVVQRSLDTETALIEYVFADEKVFALIVTQAKLQSVILPVNRTNLAAKAKLLRSMIFNGLSSSDRDWRPVAEDLRRVLIESLERTGTLEGKRRLGFILFGFLHDVPLAALARVDGEHLRFLIEDYAIFNAPSATYVTLDRYSSRTVAENSMIAFGRNESDDPDLPPLKFAALEARAVAEIFTGETRTGEQASETEFKRLARHFKFIHLATHAVSESQMPLLARVQLQSTPEDDGSLSVREILELELKAELVTLGACQTGQSFSASGSKFGELDRIGLNEAFLHAGAENVLATLLPVGDQSTTEFMKLFYLNLRTRNKTDALAETQKAMLRGNLSDPRHWSPFVLLGNYR